MSKEKKVQAADLERELILIIDDVPTNLSILENILKERVLKKISADQEELNIVIIILLFPA